MLVSATRRHSSSASLVGSITACLATMLLTLTLFPGVAAALTGRLSTNGAADSAPALMIEETDPVRTTTCRSSVDENPDRAKCPSINVFGGLPVFAPGSSHTTTMIFTNTGSAPARSFAVQAGRCSQLRSEQVSGSATDLCDRFSVRLATNGTTLFDGSAAEFGQAGAVEIVGKSAARPLAVGDTISVTLTLRLSEAADSRYQGLRITQPISWVFGA